MIVYDCTNLKHFKDEDNGPEYWIRKILIKDKKGSNKKYITNKSIDVALVCSKCDILISPES